MGLKIIKAHQECSAPEHKQIACLTDLDPLEYESNFRDILPESMLGMDFISSYGSHDDPATSIDPALSYSIATPTGHPIYENYRVKQVTDLLNNNKGDFSQEKAIQFGKYMYESHKSYSNCGLGSPETDILVRLAMAEGVSCGVFGAKITGGGCGGTVCILTSNDINGSMAINRIASQYQKETGLKARIIDGSSPGCQIFGTKILSVI
jgi:L-arabinokinase